MKEIEPIAMPGIHEKFLEFFRKRSEPMNLRIGDVHLPKNQEKRQPA